MSFSLNSNPFLNADGSIKSSSSNNGSSGSSDSMGDLQNVFTTLGNISETKAQNDQRRGQEDLRNQADVYQQFDTTASRRTRDLQSETMGQQAEIDTSAREQNSNLTKDRMRLQSQQNMAEEVNRGKVQVSTTSNTRDADLKRALSVLPRSN